MELAGVINGNRYEFEVNSFHDPAFVGADTLVKFRINGEDVLRIMVGEEGIGEVIASIMFNQKKSIEKYVDEDLEIYSMLVCEGE